MTELKRKLVLVWASAALFGLGGSAQADAKSNWEIPLSSQAGKVEFLALGRPSALKIRGKGTAVQGKIRVSETGEKSHATGSIAFELKDLDTGMETRNRHMKEKYLEVEKYPAAELQLESIELPVSMVRSGGQAKVPFRGKLLLHGVKKDVAGVAEIAMDGESGSRKTKVRSEFGLKLTDYGIAIPSFAGITVAEDVSVSVEFEAPMGEAK